MIKARIEKPRAESLQMVGMDLRKRFAALRWAKGFVGWRKQKALVTGLRGLMSVIETTGAPNGLDAAFDVPGAFPLLAPSIQERADDGNGLVRDVTRDAVGSSLKWCHA